VSKSLNKIMLIGRVEGDPEMRITPSGRPLTSFCLATSRSWVSAEGDRHDDTEWFNVVAWGALAELCQKRLADGARAYVEGRIQTRTWQDEQGKTHYRTEVVANEMINLSELPDFGEES
jgi:single-strand DNA-binding protein